MQRRGQISPLLFTLWRKQAHQGLLFQTYWILRMMARKPSMIKGERCWDNGSKRPKEDDDQIRGSGS